MPHIIIEASTDCYDQPQALIEAAFESVKNTDLFNPNNIKVRLWPIEHYQLGLNSSGFMHIHCHIHPGKTDQQKTLLTQTLIERLRPFSQVSVITAEVTETDQNTYSKWTA